jgi:hypothetical protein
LLHQQMLLEPNAVTLQADMRLADKFHLADKNSCRQHGAPTFHPYINSPGGLLAPA